MSNDKPRLSEFADYSDLTIHSFSTETLDIDLTSIDYDELELRGAVKDDELRELAEEWRQQALTYPETSEGDTARAAVRLCADELEELIDDEE